MIFLEATLTQFANNLPYADFKIQHDVSYL